LSGVGIFSGLLSGGLLSVIPLFPPPIILARHRSPNDASLLGLQYGSSYKRIRNYHPMLQAVGVMT